MHNVKSLLFTLLFLPITLQAKEPATIQISDAWIQAAPPMVSVLAGYGTIHNHSDQAISLISVSSPDFSSVEIHRSTVKNDMVSMEKQDRLSIPAGSAFTLSPGDYHFMLFNPIKPLLAGDSVEIRLGFADGQSKSVQVNIERRARNEPPDQHKHHQHSLIPATL